MCCTQGGPLRLDHCQPPLELQFGMVQLVDRLGWGTFGTVLLPMSAGCKQQQPATKNAVAAHKDATWTGPLRPDQES